MLGARLYLYLFLILTELTAVSQCIVNNAGGSNINPNRPTDVDTPEAPFSATSALNQRLPDWLCFTLGYRTRLEGYSGGNFEPHSSDSFLLTRFRVGMKVSPRSWFRVYAELQDADAFGKAQPRNPPYQETWDLRRGYLDLGDTQDGHFGLRVGRQDLNFEDGRLVGTSYWRNASKGSDAVVAATNWSRISATAFAASQVIAAYNGFSHHQAGNNLYGLDTRLKRVLPGGLVEPFVFWRLTPNLRTEAGAPARLDEKVIGARLAGTLHRAWDYDTEGALETGHLGTDRVREWAWLGIGGYTINRARYRTRLFAEFDYASGTFDPLFPNVHDHLGLADQFAWQNLKAARTGVRVWLRRNWIVAGAWGDYWLADAHHAYYNPMNQIVARDPRGLSGTHIAEEYDIQTSYRVNRDLEFGAGLGHVLPGEFLARTRHPAAYTYPYLMMSYNIF